MVLGTVIELQRLLQVPQGTLEVSRPKQRVPKGVVRFQQQRRVLRFLGQLKHLVRQLQGSIYLASDFVEIPQAP
jgi:hypothetical protein